ncbi:MAG: hypothetical protein HY869_06535 [Chloroflexi bacterium]|nr:hypothetical protein [Chloroflexota bacterium]
MKQFSRNQKLSWIAALGAALGLAAASFRLPGGDDLYRYYLPFIQGCFDCGYVPYFAQWTLAALRLLPDYPLAWPIWTLVSVVGFLTLAYVTEVNPFLLLISFPMLGQVWLGQVDVLVALGLALFLFGKNPYLRGMGLILALTKPQLTGLPILFGLLLESPRLWPKLLLAPVLTMTLSLFIYGPDWPMRWIANSTAGLPVHVWRLASMDIWRFGLFLAPLPLFFRGKRERLLSGLLVSALATPFYGVYSYVVFLLFDVKWWMALLSYAWLLGFFLWREEAMRLAWVLPVGMLLEMGIVEWKRRAKGVHSP